MIWSINSLKTKRQKPNDLVLLSTRVHLQEKLLNITTALTQMTALTRHELPQFLGNDFPDDSLTGTPEQFNSLEISSVYQQ